MARSLYEVLGLTGKAKPKEIEKAFVKLARRLHPDVNPHDPGSAAVYREAREAYRVLSNRQTKAAYDRQGRIPAPEGSGPAKETGMGRPSDSRTLEAMVREAHHGGGSEEEAVRGADVHQVLEISFLESIRGTKAEVTYQREVLCQACKGKRTAPGTKMNSCPACGGKGLEQVQRGPYKARKICARCGGAGTVGAEPCARCGGKGRTLRTEKRAVPVPAGADSGTELRVRGAGQPGKGGGTRGDLVVTVKVRPHPHLQRRGNNLYCSVPVTVAEAALGATILVPTAERKASLTIPPGTQCGQQFRLRGKGVPVAGGEKRTDLYVEVKVVIPAATEGSAKHLFREVAKIFPENPRVYG